MIDKFLEAIDDERENSFITQWGLSHMTKNDLYIILLTYINAVHAQGKGFEDDCREYIREELEEMTCKL